MISNHHEPYGLADFDRLPPIDEKPSRGHASPTDDVLTEAIERLGLAVGDGVDGGLDITCPWEAEHSTPGSPSATTYWPARGDKPGFKCQHSHCSGRTVKDLIAELRRRDRTLDGHYEDTRPTIRLIEANLHDNVRDAGAALAAFNDGLYRHGQIVRINHDKIKNAGGTDGDALRFHAVSSIHIQERMTAAAQFEKWSDRERDWTARKCPREIAEMYMAKGQWDELPFVLGITTTPTLRPDGTLLDKVGFDPATGIFYDTLGVVFPEIKEHPTKEDARAALDLLKRPLRKFPFHLPSHTSVALSAMLSPLVRLSLPTVPMHAFSAPVAGSGKSMLVDMASMIATGRTASVMTKAQENLGEGELEKRLGASLLAGKAIISIDNVEGPLSGALLCQVLTQTSASIRILGKSVNVDVPVASSFFATGNNLTVVGDLTRRVLVATLTMKTERPELLKFSFDPLKMVEADRAAYVCAAITIMRAYIMSGERVDVVPLGSFVEWSKMVREALIWVGEADPVAVLDEVRKNDPRLQKLKAVMAAWTDTFGDSPKLLRDVIKAAMDCDDDGNPTNADLREALYSIAEKGKDINSEKLFWWLRRNAHRVVEKMKFEREDGDDHKTKWKLVGEPTTDYILF